MLYKNKKTGAVIETQCDCAGDWVKINKTGPVEKPDTVENNEPEREENLENDSDVLEDGDDFKNNDLFETEKSPTKKTKGRPSSKQK